MKINIDNIEFYAFKDNIYARINPFYSSFNTPEDMLHLKYFIKVPKTGELGFDFKRLSENNKEIVKSLRFNKDLPEIKNHPRTINVSKEDQIKELDNFLNIFNIERDERNRFFIKEEFYEYYTSMDSIIGRFAFKKIKKIKYKYYSWDFILSLYNSDLFYRARVRKDKNIEKGYIKIKNKIDNYKKYEYLNLRRKNGGVFVVEKNPLVEIPT